MVVLPLAFRGISEFIVWAGDKYEERREKR
jgi:hypothetical protein